MGGEPEECRSRPRGRDSAAAAEGWAPRDARPTGLPSPGGRDKERAPCGCGGSEREWAWDAQPCWGPGPRAGTLQGTPAQGSPEAGVTGARAAPRRPVHACLWVEKRPRNTWVGAGRRLCRHGAVSGAGSGAALPCARRRSAASPAAPPRSSCPRSPGTFSAAAERLGRNSCDVFTKLK